jgi:tetratricopeptide (TPR) repeat protein
MRRSLTILFLFLIVSHCCSAQFKKQIDSLSAVSNRLGSDSEKVIALGKLADLYYTFQLNKEADSILNKQLLIADVSNNNNLVLLALFGNTITNINTSTTSEIFNKAIQFVQKGINYAKSITNYEYIGLGYIRMANLLRQRGQYDEALSNANLALGNLHHIKSDSIKALIYIELGNTYQARKEAVFASQSYNSAFDIAIKIKSIPLQSEVYHCFSEMYMGLGNIDIAKEELKKSLALNKEHNYSEGMVRDYYDLARITDEKFFIEKTIELAHSIRSARYVLQGKVLMFYYYMVAEKNSDKALNYLKSEPDVNQSILNLGIPHYYRTIGQVYYYGNKADSALKYFKMAESEYVNNFGQKLSRGIFREIANAYKQLNDIPNAIQYYSRALELSKQLNDASLIAGLSDSLSNLYEAQGNYTLAFSFSKQSKQFQDSLRKLSEGRDIALLNVERENRKHEEEVRQEQQKLNNKRNLQYMLITIAIAIIFSLMLIMGMFPISKLTIKMLGYFFFISLFEFIVLLIDTFLHRITHGEPLKIWLIKIFIIALLVPVQHFLEHRMIKFLESRKLLKARSRLSLKYWLAKIKTKNQTPAKEVDFEEGTAVL